MRSTISKLIAAAIAVVVTAPVLAQQAAPTPAAPAATPVRVRGVVDSLTGDVLAVTTREGSKLTIMMQPNWTVETVVAVKVDEIKAGDFVGASAIKRADGKMVAQAIHYLPIAIRERSAGDTPWDLTPESRMINADLGQVVKSADGQMTVKMTNTTATYDLVIPPTIPIVKYVPADKSLLKAGAAIFMGTQKQPNGTYTATLVRAESNGVKPPL